MVPLCEQSQGLRGGGVQAAALMEGSCPQMGSTHVSGLGRDLSTKNH